VMGAGIARTIQYTFPEAYKADKAGPKERDMRIRTGREGGS
jgi:hypothetical protein